MARRGVVSPGFAEIGPGGGRDAGSASRDPAYVSRPDAKGRALLRAAIDRLGLSARGYDRVLKVARTIADLAASESVKADHVAEALQYRLIE